MKLAFVFPGQGSQSVGMMAGYAGLSQIDETMVAVDAAPRRGDHGIDRQRPGGRSQRHHQHATGDAGGDVAGVECLVCCGRAEAGVGGRTQSRGIRRPGRIRFARDFVSAMKLVKARLQAMQDAVPAGIGGMAAVLGIEPGPLAEVCGEDFAGRGGCLLQLNAPGQIVIGGHKSAVERAIVPPRKREPSARCCCR